MAKLPKFILPADLPEPVRDYIKALEEIADGDLDIIQQRNALAARLKELYEEVSAAVQSLRDYLTVLALDRTTLAEMTLPMQCDLLLVDMRDAERQMDARLHRLAKAIKPPKG